MKGLRKVGHSTQCHPSLVVLTGVCIQGKWEKIGGVDCYVGTPTCEYPKDKAILYLADIFGPQLINAQVCSLLIIVLHRF